MLKTFARVALAAAILTITGVPSMTSAKQPTYSAHYAEDRAEIEDLMARYLFAIDYFDWDSYVDTFAPDGELTFASGTYKGRDEIRKALISFSQPHRPILSHRRRQARQAAPRDPAIVDPGRRRKAWGRTLWVEMANHGPGDTMKMGTYGIYEDEFSKIDGHWLIQKRNVLNEFIKGRNSGPNNPVRDMDALAEAAKKVSYASDRAEIEDLMARYLFAMDYHDADTYAECFTEDGELDWAMGVAKGRDAIRAEAQGVQGAHRRNLQGQLRRPGQASPRGRAQGDPHRGRSGVEHRFLVRDDQRRPRWLDRPAELRRVRGRARAGRRHLAVQAAQDLQRVPPRPRVQARSIRCSPWTLRPQIERTSMIDFAGRTAFVTGGANGVGIGIVRNLLEAGAKVAIADVRQDFDRPGARHARQPRGHGGAARRQEPRRLRRCRG